VWRLATPVRTTGNLLANPRPYRRPQSGTALDQSGLKSDQSEFPIAVVIFQQGSYRSESAECIALKREMANRRESQNRAGQNYRITCSPGDAWFRGWLSCRSGGSALDGISADTKASEHVSISFGSSAEDHFEHGIQKVTAIRLMPPRGESREVVSRDGMRAVLQLSRPNAFPLPVGAG